MQIGHNRNGKLPLDEIEAFVEVATAGSFSAAAEALHISHSSLSRKVAYLEARIGERLLDRNAKGVQMTTAGLERFMRFRDALGLISRSLGRSRSVDESALVRISMLDSFAIFWQFRHHAAIMEQLEGINLNYEIDIRPTNFDDGSDLAIRFGLGGWSDTRGVALMETRYRPMACKEIADQLGPDASTDDILKFPLIHMKSETSWMSWLERQGVYLARRPQDRTFNELPSVLAAVQNGLGIGLSRAPFLHLVDSGRNLAHVSPHAINTQATYYLLRDARRPAREPVRRYAEVMLNLLGISAEEIRNFLSD